MKLIVVGKAASGKDFLKKKVEKRGFKSGVSFTTRPPRQNEKNGEDYHFVTEQEFDQLIKDGQMVEWMEFIGWKYGLTIEEFEKADIMIMSKDGLEMLPKKYRDRCFVIYLDVDRMVRLDRLNTRNDKNDNVWRRMSTDEKQFDSFTDYDIKIKNEDF